VYGHVARNCSNKIVTHDKATTTTNGGVVTGSGGGAPEKTPEAELSPTNSAIMEGLNEDAEIKGEDLYGDWLVVNKKKNQGRKSRPKIQEETTSFQGGAQKKSQRQDLNFSHLNNAGSLDIEGPKQHEWGPPFHPGGLSEIPKVWTKKNKRARGMVNNNREPKNLETVGLHSKPKGKSVNLTPTILERTARVGSGPQALVLSSQANYQNKQQALVFVASKNDDRPNQRIELFHKPPDTNGIPTQPSGSGERTSVDDEMVVENQAAPT
jgi:hypothetical protein